MAPSADNPYIRCVWLAAFAILFNVMAHQRGGMNELRFMPEAHLAMIHPRLFD